MGHPPSRCTPVSKNDQALLTKTPREILKGQKVEVKIPPRRKSNAVEDTEILAEVVAQADAGLPEALDEEGTEAPSDDVIKETCKRYAFRFHKRCSGKGYTLELGRVVVCQCAAKRMKRRIEDGD